MKIEIDSYAGSVPRVAEYLLSKTQSALAMDCRFDHGTLDAWREPLHVRNATAGTVTTVQVGCCWIDFNKCVDVAKGPVTCQRVYITGNTAYPQVVEVNQSDCVASYKRLGIPCDLEAPSALVTASTGIEKDQEGRTYAYLFENSRGERGALSRASDAVLVYEGGTVVVSGWTAPALEWDVVNILLYRAVSSTGSGSSNVSADNTADTTWMLVATLPVGTISYTDSKRNEALTEALEVDGLATPPPEGLRGMTAVDSMNCLAGYIGNRLYFSENNRYHSWVHYLDLDDNIRGIIESNGLLYVATDGHPYVVEALADCKEAGCRKVTRYGVSLPMVPTGNKHMAALPSGAVYPSHNGLVSLSGNSNPVIVTNPLYAPEDWQRLQPNTVVPEMHGGKLFVFAKGGSFVLKLNDTIEPGWTGDLHSELSDKDVVDVFSTRQGDMYLLKENGAVQLWDRGSSLRPYHWKSPLWALPSPVAMAAFRLRVTQGSVKATIYVDRLRAFDETVLRTNVAMLPMWAFGTDWQLELRGTATVGPFALATSVGEL